jgi:hypothetical protein
MGKEYMKFIERLLVIYREEKYHVLRLSPGTIGPLLETMTR